MSVKIERNYARILAQRGVEEYMDRARGDAEYQEDVLVHHGISVSKFLPFVHKRMNRTDAHEYVRKHPSDMYRYLIGKAREYKSMVEVFSIEKETFIEFSMKEARKLIKFERNDDPTDNVYC